MTKEHVETGEEFVKSWQESAKHLEENGMYDPAEEHSSCGVGMVANVDGVPTRRVVELAVDALKKLWHRGAVDADGLTGDGAGIHVQIPWEFFKEHIRRTGHEVGDEKIAVGMVFLPKTDLGAQEVCRSIVETEILRAGYRIYGWRQVPAAVEVIGEKPMRHALKSNRSCWRPMPVFLMMILNANFMWSVAASKNACWASTSTISTFAR